MKNQTVFRPIPVLTKRMFRTNRGRNLVAVLAILLTTMMFATLFTLTQSMSRNLVEMTFRQTGYNAQASMRGLTEEQAEAGPQHRAGPCRKPAAYRPVRGDPLGQ